MGYLQIHVPSGILCPYYASVLMGCVNVSSCLECVPIYQETLPTNIANMRSAFFTVHKLCLIIANYSSFTVSL